MISPVNTKKIRKFYFNIKAKPGSNLTAEKFRDIVEEKFIADKWRGAKIKRFSTDEIYLHFDCSLESTSTALIENHLAQYQNVVQVSVSYKTFANENDKNDFENFKPEETYFIVSEATSGVTIAELKTIIECSLFKKWTGCIAQQSEIFNKIYIMLNQKLNEKEVQVYLKNQGFANIVKIEKINQSLNSNEIEELERIYQKYSQSSLYNR